MKRLFLLLGLLLALVLQPVAAWGIVYGEPDNGQHPQVGSFVAEVTEPQTGDTLLVPLCTGTLVDSDVVLSAAHCFAGLPDFFGDITFTLDEVIDADRDGLVDADVELMTGTPFVHPEFGSGGANNTYDIAVFLLDQAVTDVTPASLPEAGLLDKGLRDETFVAVGYGTLRETNRKAWQAFGMGWRREMAEQGLLSVTPAWATFSMNLATDDGGTCYGDSGGPHFLGDSDVVVSLTVDGDTYCKATDKTYRLDTRWAREFLSSYVTLP